MSPSLRVKFVLFLVCTNLSAEGQEEQSDLETRLACAEAALDDLGEIWETCNPNFTSLQEETTEMRAAVTSLQETNTELRAMVTSLQVENTKLMALIYGLIQPTDLDCPSGYTQLLSFGCLKLIRHATSRTAPQAEQLCNADGGHLATIDSAVKSEVVLDYVRRQKVQLGFSPSYVWIGLSDDVIKGEHRWMATNELAAWTNWASGTLDSNGHGLGCTRAYTYAYTSGSFQWVDDSWTRSIGGNSFAPLCEYHQ